MLYGIKSESHVQGHQKKIVAPALSVSMVGATILQFDIQLENTDLYTVNEEIDNHGS